MKRVVKRKWFRLRKKEEQKRDELFGAEEIEQMAARVVNARFGFVTVFKGMVVVEDTTLPPDSYELRVGSKLFQEIEFLRQKNLE